MLCRTFENIVPRIKTMKNSHSLHYKESKIDKIVNPKLNILDSIINVDLNNKKLSNDIRFF